MVNIVLICFVFFGSLFVYVQKAEQNGQCQIRADAIITKDEYFGVFLVIMITYAI